VPAVTDATRPESNLFGQPPVDVTALYVPTLNYVVTGLQQTDRIRPRDGKLIPTIQVAFQVPGSPGNFTILIDNYAFTYANPLEYMNERSYLIRSLYSLPAVLPPYVPYGGYATGVVLTLDTATATTMPDGSGAVAWTGTIMPRGVAATARFEVTALGDADPSLVSNPIPVTASDTAQPLSGTLGPLDPGKYTVQLTADSSLGLGLSPLLVVTIP
jgi:hypothetical protein